MFSRSREGNKWTSGQSLIELAILLPVLFLLLAGMVEFGFLFYSYMTALDLTREAARFASSRDYRKEDPPHPTTPFSACEDTDLNFYYDTACFFIDPEINPTLPITNTRFEDVTISVFSIENGIVTNRWPANSYGVWSLYNDNWRYDCHGTLVRNEPYFTNAEIESKFVSGAPVNRGLVLVEMYFCYKQLLDLPGLNYILDNPMSLHTYTIMPAPEAIPTPTPLP
jgi:hypothetical protein